MILSKAFPMALAFRSFPLHTFILSSFAIAQPLFNLLSRNTTFFVVRRSEPLDILIFCALVCVGLPLCLILIEKGLRWIHPTMGWCARTSIIGVLVALLILQGLRQIAILPGTVLILGAIGLATLIVWSYARSASVRLFFSLLSPGLLLFPALFVFFSPVSKLVFPDGTVIPQPQQAAKPVPVVMVIFDELPLSALLNDKLEIDSARFPNIAAFVQEATWFRNATTVSIETTFSIPAILTGNYPDAIRIPTAADYPHNLFTLLGSSHDLKVSEALTQLCPEHLCPNNIFQRTLLWARLHTLIVDVSAVLLHLVLPQDWRDRLPDITQNWMNFMTDIPHSQADMVWNTLFKWQRDILPQHPRIPPQRFGDFIEAIQGTERPTLYFTHLLLPHSPYMWLPSGQQYSLQTGLPGLVSGRWLDDELAVSQGYQRYLRQVGFVDTLIGRLIFRLKTQGLYDRSLIVLTADHGVSFRLNQPNRLLTEENAPDIIRVPLFMKAPYQRDARTNDRNVETVDIVPTIADLLEVSLPWPMDGQSAFDSVRPDKREKVVFASSPATENYHDRYVFAGALPASQNRNASLSLAFGLEEGQAGGRYGFRLYPNLVGHEVSAFQIKEDTDIAIMIDRRDLFSQVDPSGDFIPAHITGAIRLNGTRQFPPLIALALNGRIQSVTRPWSFPVQGRSGLWAALVDENVFRAGQNNIEGFVVALDGESLSLVRGTGHFSHLPLYPHAQEERITSPQGKPVPVSTGTLRGWVDSALVKDGKIEIVGWAADIKNTSPPQAIWVYVNNQFFYAGQTHIARATVARLLNNVAFYTTGFHYTFPLTQFADMAEVKIRVFAVSQDEEVAEISSLPIQLASRAPVSPRTVKSISPYPPAKYDRALPSAMSGK